MNLIIYETFRKAFNCKKTIFLAKLQKHTLFCGWAKIDITFLSFLYKQLCIQIWLHSKNIFFYYDNLDVLRI